jgi:hypothetical protein
LAERSKREREREERGKMKKEKEEEEKTQTKRFANKTAKIFFHISRTSNGGVAHRERLARDVLKEQVHVERATAITATVLHSEVFKSAVIVKIASSISSVFTKLPSGSVPIGSPK